jgi:hypothetical protein
MTVEVNGSYFMDQMRNVDNWERRTVIFTFTITSVDTGM